MCWLLRMSITRVMKQGTGFSAVPLGQGFVFVPPFHFVLTSMLPSHVFFFLFYPAKRELVKVSRVHTIDTFIRNGRQLHSDLFQMVYGQLLIAFLQITGLGQLPHFQAFCWMALVILPSIAYALFTSHKGLSLNSENLGMCPLKSCLPLAATKWRSTQVATLSKPRVKQSTHYNCFK